MIFWYGTWKSPSIYLKHMIMVKFESYTSFVLDVLHVLPGMFVLLLKLSGPVEV